MDIRVCKYAPCSVEFTPTHRHQRYHSSLCGELQNRDNTRIRDGKARLSIKAKYKARGIAQDNVHPNERRDMSQHVGTFKIEEGKIITR